MFGAPEAVDDIARGAMNIDDCACGNMNLIGRANHAIGLLVDGILDLPPPFMSIHVDFECGRGSERGDETCNQHDEEKSNGHGDRRADNPSCAPFFLWIGWQGRR
jgi:hypothetical protein